jgi:hypothetical protein
MSSLLIRLHTYYVPPTSIRIAINSPSQHQKQNFISFKNKNQKTASPEGISGSFI